MNKYIGTKLIEAKEMNLGDYNKFKGWTIPKNEDPKTEGYMVKYSDDYISWSPKDVFEKSYMQVGDNNTITKQNVEDFIKEVHSQTIGEKTTLVRVTLVNGFELIESSACVDKANYDNKLGTEICLDKIKDKIWMLLGFLLQTAKEGIN
jgi:hypothetical protein